MKKTLKNLLIPLVLIAISACSKDIENRGYVVKFSDFSKIKPGVTTKEQVLKDYGTPTTTSIFGQETWYYIGKEQTKETFFDPKVKTYDGYAISFNDKGIVSDVKVKGKSDLKKVDVEDDHTETAGNHITIWQQLFGNLGKFNPTGRQNRGVSPGAMGTSYPGR